jgi:hypothetical protein
MWVDNGLPTPCQRGRIEHNSGSTDRATHFILQPGNRARAVAVPAAACQLHAHAESCMFEAGWDACSIPPGYR